MKKLSFILFLSVASLSAAPQPRWLLKPFLSMGEENPQRLLKLANNLFSPERMRIVSIEARYAFEWQHRLAMVGALSTFFDPIHKKNPQVNASVKERARLLIKQAMLSDSSLLVRDGAVESVRRIMQMSPGEASVWRGPLEAAFRDKNNEVRGEGLFIRETILTALYEGALKPSASVRKLALKDKNLQVRELLKTWKTSAYDN